MRSVSLLAAERKFRHCALGFASGDKVLPYPGSFASIWRMRGNPVIESHPDGYKVTWPGFKKAFALFDIVGTGVIVTDIFRDPAQPKGSAGPMLADALIQAGARRPVTIRVANILDTQPTVRQLASGLAPENTVLGGTLQNTVSALGGRITAWREGMTRDKQWIEVSIVY